MSANKIEGYVRPPITEAVIGLTFADTIDNKTLETVSKQFAGHYPAHQAVKNVEFHFDLTEGAGKKHEAVATQSEVHGHKRSTPDMSEIVLVLPTSLVVSQLAPYPSWDVFFKRFLRDWRIWKRSVKHRVIKRIGVRYINRIDIPVDGLIVNHELYLSVYPKVPELLSPLNAFVVQTISGFDDIKCRLTLNSAVVESPVLNRQSFSLDLDIAREVEVPQKDKDIFALLESMRVKKNLVFESCITERARTELFGGALHVK